MKHYRIAFEPWGLLLFLVTMVPNLIWSAVPAPNDILRGTSATEALDAAASVCQVLFVAALCAVVNRESVPLRLTPLIRGTVCCEALYAAGWCCYYLGFAGPAVILALTVPPCLAFLFYALDRKNFIAVVPLAAFTICHLIYSVVNFLI